jgi:hypothetical protein
MLFDGFQFTYYLPGDELIDIEAFLANDSLLSAGGGIQNPDQVSFFAVVYPNPSSQEVNIRVSAGGREDISVTIYDHLDKQIAVLPDGEYSYGSYFAKWDVRTQYGSKATADIYFYEVLSGNYRTGGKIVVAEQGISHQSLVISAALSKVLMSGGANQGRIEGSLGVQRMSLYGYY